MTKAAINSKLTAWILLIDQLSCPLNQIYRRFSPSPVILSICVIYTMSYDLKTVNIINRLINKAKRCIASYGKTDLHAKLAAIIDQVSEWCSNKMLSWYDQHRAASLCQLFNKQTVTLDGIDMAFNMLICYFPKS